MLLTVQSILQDKGYKTLLSVTYALPPVANAISSIRIYLRNISKNHGEICR